MTLRDNYITTQALGMWAIRRSSCEEARHMWFDTGVELGRNYRLLACQKCPVVIAADYDVFALSREDPPGAE